MAARKTVAQLEVETNLKLDAILAAIAGSPATPDESESTQAKTEAVSPDPMLVVRDQNGTPRVAVLCERPFGKNAYITFVATDADGVMHRNAAGKVSGKRIAPAAFLAAAESSELIAAAKSALK